jgi:hypothetical protein
MNKGSEGWGEEGKGMDPVTVSHVNPGNLPCVNDIIIAVNPMKAPQIRPQKIRSFLCMLLYPMFCVFATG